MFIIYVNDICDATKYKSILFADDISVVVTSNKYEGIKKHVEKINEMLIFVIDWLGKHNLQINVEKTNYVQFNTKLCKSEELNIHYKNKTIAEMDNVTFLGLKLDKYLDWNEQIEKVCSKINRFVYVLRRLRRTSGLQASLAAYHGYISSNLRYGLILWGASSSLDRAFIAQKKCIRAICDSRPYKSCRDMFKNLKILTLPSLYILESCIFVKNHMELFTTAKTVYPRGTRNEGRLYMIVFLRLHYTG